VFVFINKAGTAQAHDHARQIAERLRQHDRQGRVDRIIVGDVRERMFQVV
jgi:hypothetical protein